MISMVNIIGICWTPWRENKLWKILEKGKILISSHPHGHSNGNDSQMKILGNLEQTLCKRVSSNIRSSIIYNAYYCGAMIKNHIDDDNVFDIEYGNSTGAHIWIIFTWNFEWYRRNILRDAHILKQEVKWYKLKWSQYGIRQSLRIFLNISTRKRNSVDSKIQQFIRVFLLNIGS